jgi:hypothetical protein
MADAVHRIVPPSVSLDRVSGLGRERERRNPNEKQHAEAAIPSSDHKADEQDVLTESAQDKIKGKNLDINA